MVPIIIPFFREHEKLRKCQAAIAAQTHPGCEVFVRDNTHDNILFTAAVNEGLSRYCWRPDVRYVMVLNQDAYMHPDCVRHLVEFMDANPECGIACPIQYADTPGGGGIRWGGPGTPLSVGSSRAVTWGGSWQAFPFGRHRKDPFGSYRAPLETFWANGACMMIRVETIREVGMLDRNMRFICSDGDFSFTARARGWKVFVVPQALAEHSLNQSGSAANPEIELVKCRDALYFANKWLTGGLYRSLSFEGPQLTRIGVRKVTEKIQRDIRALCEHMGRAPVSDPRELLLQMFTELPAPRASPWSVAASA